MDYFVKSFLILILSVIFMLGIYNPLLAYVMQSSNYKIQSDDSLTPTSGLGTSTNYIFLDTMGQVSSGVSNSNSYKIKAGFQQMQEVSLSVTSPGNINLGNIPGISGGTVSNNSYWKVQTDSSSGFDMKINASTIPAMKLPPDGTYYFDDYFTTPTHNWNIGSNAAKFGFAVTPATVDDSASTLKDNGSACGLGSNVGNCWSGFNGTNPIVIIHRQNRTDANGENELITFKAQSNKFMNVGNYVSSITITVSSN
ncbi:MAG: hypothetical protein NT094_01085 [Candidatus Staskawiczbacteria bacterium]|nr:hypothetical protein [Candidatus Staskawiczbacteria bacterium]